VRGGYGKIGIDYGEEEVVIGGRTGLLELLSGGGETLRQGCNDPVAGGIERKPRIIGFELGRWSGHDRAGLGDEAPEYFDRRGKKNPPPV